MDNFFIQNVLISIAVVASTCALLYYVNLLKKKHMEKMKEESYLKCKSLWDFEELAQILMKPHRFHYYDYKAGQGATYKACREYFDNKLRILPRVLLDVTHVSLKTSIFGSTYECPIIIAPTAFHCLAHPLGEVGTATGATEAQCIYTYNWVYANKSEKDVLQTAGPKYLHVYLHTNVDQMHHIIQQADEKGYRAIVVTCDHPTYRIRDHIIPIFTEASIQMDPSLLKTIETPNINTSDRNIQETPLRISVTWQNIAQLRKLTTLPIICKGILSPVDAQLAIQYGANGIVVSNHGGRQIDTAPPAIECLEDIIKTVDGQVEVFVDSGIRSGTDILKALALGARGVFIGRPVLYGLACGGDDGVRKVLEILKNELKYDMACCGITTINQINRNILYKHN